MVVIGDIVCVRGVEGLLSNVAARLVVEVEGEPVLLMLALLIIVERHRHLLLEVHHLIQEPFHTVLPHFELV